jgi:hypothetical protein
MNRVGGMNESGRFRTAKIGAHARDRCRGRLERPQSDVLAQTDHVRVAVGRNETGLHQTR